MSISGADRLRLWRALSDLFLDTELEESMYRHIARVIAEDQYTTEEAENILWAEVFPVLEGNLRNVAGVWAGWPDEWLLNNLKPTTSTFAPAAINGNAEGVREIKSCWKKVIIEVEKHRAQQ
mgnify:CR=1 FL=1